MAAWVEQVLVDPLAVDAVVDRVGLGLDLPELGDGGEVGAALGGRRRLPELDVDLAEAVRRRLGPVAAARACRRRSSIARTAIRASVSSGGSSARTSVEAPASSSRAPGQEQATGGRRRRWRATRPGGGRRCRRRGTGWSPTPGRPQLDPPAGVVDRGDGATVALAREGAEERRGHLGPVLGRRGRRARSGTGGTAASPRRRRPPAPSPRTASSAPVAARGSSPIPAGIGCPGLVCSPISPRSTTWAETLPLRVVQIACGRDPLRTLASISPATSWAGPTRRTTSSSPRRACPRTSSREMSWMKGEPDWMLDFRLKSLRHFERGRCPTGAPTSRASTSTTSSTTSSPPTPGRRVGGAARRHQGDLREAGHPRGRAQVPRRRHRPVRVRGRLPPQPGRPRGQGRHLLRHGHRPPGAPGAGEALLRQDHPAERQQVRRPQLVGVVGRLVHLRAAGRRGGHAAAGLLPDQRREHGPVRAHADHRRRGLQVHYIEGCSAPVYTTDSLHSPWSRSSSSRRPGSPTPPSRTGRTTSSTWSPSGPGSRPRPHGVDRRQHRLAGHDEVPGRLAGRPQGVGRGAVGGLRRPGQHQDTGAKMVHAALETTSKIVSKSISKDGGRTSYRGLVRVEDDALRLQEPRPVRRPDPRRRERQRHLPLHGDRCPRRQGRPRGHRVEGRRRADLLPDVPRPRRSRPWA